MKQLILITLAILSTTALAWRKPLALVKEVKKYGGEVYEEGRWNPPVEWMNIRRILAEDTHTNYAHRAIGLFDKRKSGGENIYSAYSSDDLYIVSDGVTTNEYSNYYHQVIPWIGEDYMWVLVCSNNRLDFSWRTINYGDLCVGSLWVVYTPNSVQSLEYVDTFYGLNTLVSIENLTIYMKDPNNDFLSFASTLENAYNWKFASDSPRVYTDISSRVRKAKLQYSSGEFFNIQDSSSFTDCNAINITINSVDNDYSFSWRNNYHLVEINGTLNNSATVYLTTFQNCAMLRKLPQSFAPATISNGFGMFQYCFSLEHLPPNFAPTVSGNTQEMFYRCNSLTDPIRLSFIEGGSVGSGAFSGCSKVPQFDFSGSTIVPPLANINAFSGISPTAKIIVPDSLYDEWIAAPNWSDATIVSHIVKASEVQ